MTIRLEIRFLVASMYKYFVAETEELGVVVLLLEDFVLIVRLWRNLGENRIRTYHSNANQLYFSVSTSCFL